MEKKLVLPGDHLSSAEESEPGENTYSEKDEVYSAAVGENISAPGHAAVKGKGRKLRLPAVGSEVYCLITKTGPNKAIAGCITADEVEGKGRGIEMDGVLLVTAIRRGYVRDIRDEVKMGDIIKAKVQEVRRNELAITMMDPQSGVVAAFCPKCRQRMDLKDRLFICSRCGWKERRKLPLAEGEALEQGEAEPRYERRERPPFRRGPRREGGPPRREGFHRGGYGGAERR
ncbi:MAG: exosome complex RNA-binding protein Csl4 [Candidatus ainarchaeum sp.]|nr:exosome complex RNA-binding protein Csl4 [Candidatus ainarchaeum sp.]